MKTLIKNGLVLLLNEEGWRAEKKDLLIEGNRIIRIADAIPSKTEKKAMDASPANGGEKDQRAAVAEKACEVIDAAGKLVMPGLINAHTHAYMTIHRNFADDLAFFDWLDHVDRVEQGMTEEDVYWTTMLAIIEMIRSGTTCFVDMSIKSAKAKSGPMAAVAGAVLDAGFRAVICRGLAGVADSEESLRKYGEAVHEMDLLQDESRLQFVHGPHAPYSCMADYLQKLTQSCRDRGIGQHIHLSESQAEMEGIAKDHGGMTPIQYADSLGVFDVPCIVAHAVYATEDDIRIMAEKGVSVAACPKSNMKLGNGFAPVEKMLAAGVNVCLGTDGCGSNNSLNMFQEMNAAALVYKGANRKAQCVGAGEVLRMATVGGAKAIGREGELGVIREGALADLILIDLHRPQFMPANNILSGLVYSATGNEVDTVMVDGRILMKDGKLTTIDEEKVFEACRGITARLKMEEKMELEA
ncbi:MAG: amidohydrolase [Clostridia bacterium]|nr:amidohydrolase [Clostridia bacterium]